MKLVVNVTNKHIARGKPRNVCECPIAKALNNLGYTAVVNWDAIIINDGKNQYFIPTTKKAQKFINDFDNWGEAKPTEFTFHAELLEENLCT